MITRSPRTRSLLFSVAGAVLVACGSESSFEDPANTYEPSSVPEEEIGGIAQALGTCTASTVTVSNQAGATADFSTVEDALTCLDKRRLTTATHVVIAPGTYQPYLQANGETRGLGIDHPDAHLLTIRGQSRLEIPLQSFNSHTPVQGAFGIRYYNVKYNLNHQDWLSLKDHLNGAPEAYVIIRGTRPLASAASPDNHFLNRGVWKISRDLTIGTLDRLVIELIYRPNNDPHAGTFGSAPELPNLYFDGQNRPTAVILTSVLNFRCSPGVAVTSTFLGGMRDLVLVGDYEASEQPSQCIWEKDRTGSTSRTWSMNFPGLTMAAGAGAVVGPYVGIARFDGQGFLATDHGWLLGSWVAASGNERRGYYAQHVGGLDLVDAIASGNQQDGFIADNTGQIRATRSTAAGNRWSGFAATHGGSAKVYEGTAANNGRHGFQALNLGVLSIADIGASGGASVATQNGEWGLHAEHLTHFSANRLNLRRNGAGTFFFDAYTSWALGSTVEEGCTGFICGGLSMQSCNGTPVYENGMLKCGAPVDPALRRLMRTAYSPRAATSGAYVPTGTVNVGPASSVPSLHHFFNESGDNRIANKLLTLPKCDAENCPPKDYTRRLEVKLEEGIHVLRGNPLIINHPDARRVNVRGAACMFHVSMTGTASSCGAGAEVTCREVTANWSPYSDGDATGCDGFVVGDIIKLWQRGAHDRLLNNDEVIHAGVWQVSAANGTQIRFRSIGPNYVDSASIGILTGTKYKTILYFPESTGSFVIDGTTLGSLENLAIVGPKFVPITTSGSRWSSLASRTVSIPFEPTPIHSACTKTVNGTPGYLPEYTEVNGSRSGLSVQNCGHVAVYNTSVVGFHGAGVTAASNSSVGAWVNPSSWLQKPVMGTIAATGNGGSGIFATTDSSVGTGDASISSNGSHGVRAISGSAVSVDGSLVSRNALDGLLAEAGGYITAAAASTVRNGRNGAFANESSVDPTTFSARLLVNELLAEANGNFGIRAAGRAFAFAEGAVAARHQNSATLNLSGVHVADGARCDCADLTMRKNDWPMKVSGGAAAFTHRIKNGVKLLSGCSQNTNPYILFNTGFASEQCELFSAPGSAGPAYWAGGWTNMRSSMAPVAYNTTEAETRITYRMAPGAQMPAPGSSGTSFGSPAGYTIYKITFDYLTNYDNARVYAGLTIPGSANFWTMDAWGVSQGSATLEVPDIGWFGLGMFTKQSFVAPPADWNWLFQVDNLRFYYH